MLNRIAYNLGRIAGAAENHYASVKPHVALAKQHFETGRAAQRMQAEMEAKAEEALTDRVAELVKTSYGRFVPLGK